MPTAVCTFSWLILPNGALMGSACLKAGCKRIICKLVKHRAVPFFVKLVGDRAPPEDSFHLLCSGYLTFPHLLPVYAYLRLLAPKLQKIQALLTLWTLRASLWLHWLYLSRAFEHIFSLVMFHGILSSLVLEGEVNRKGKEEMGQAEKEGEGGWRREGRGGEVEMIQT